MNNVIVKKTDVMDVMVKHYKMQDDFVDIVDTSNESRCQTVLLVVDRNNVDSLLGAALWVSKMDFDKSVKVHNFHPLDNNYPVGDYDQVVIFGCYIPEQLLKTNFSGTKHTKIFCYREMYPESKIIKESSSMQVVRPCEDWYGAEQALIDNSIAWNVNIEMLMQDKGTGIMCLKSVIRDVAMFINFAHKGIKTFKEQIKIHNVMVVLDRAFSKNNIRSAILDLRPIVDEDGYKLRLEQVRQTTKLHAGKHRFVVSGKGLGGVPTNYTLPAIACPANMSRDVMKMIVPVKGSCMTYEDVRNYRIVRVMTKDRRQSLVLVNLLKPYHVWEEGPVIVAIIPAIPPMLIS